MEVGPLGCAEAAVQRCHDEDLAHLGDRHRSAGRIDAGARGRSVRDRVGVPTQRQRRIPRQSRGTNVRRNGDIDQPLRRDQRAAGALQRAGRRFEPASGRAAHDGADRQARAVRLRFGARRGLQRDVPGLEGSADVLLLDRIPSARRIALVFRPGLDGRSDHRRHTLLEPTRTETYRDHHFKRCDRDRRRPHHRLHSRATRIPQRYGRQSPAFRRHRRERIGADLANQGIRRAGARRLDDR